MMHKSCLFILVALIAWGSPASLFAVQGELVVVERKLFGDFRFFGLEVDREGAFYFGSFDEIVKLRPDGRRAFERSARDLELRTIHDLRISPTGDLIIAGLASEPDASIPKTRVVVMNPEGQIRTSFDVPGFIVKIVEGGDRGETVLLGQKWREGQQGPDTRFTVCGFGAGGDLLFSFEVDEQDGTTGSWRSRRLTIAGRDFVLVEPTRSGLLLRRFSTNAPHVNESHLRFTWPESSVGRQEMRLGEARARYMAADDLTVRLSFFSPFDERTAIMEVIAPGQIRTLKRGKTTIHQLSSRTLYLVSLDGERVRPLAFSESGILQAIGRDGFLYFVRNHHEGREIQTEVLKARLK